MRIRVKFFLIVEDTVLNKKIVTAYRLTDLCDIVSSRVRRLLDDWSILIAEMKDLVAVERPVGVKSERKLSEVFV